MELICNNLSKDGSGRLLMSSADVCSIASEYGTPLYIMDSDRIIENCKRYTESAKCVFGDNSKIIYASKAASFAEMYRIVKDQGMYADLVSTGEIATAEKAGFPMERTFFHSCSKTDRDIRFALEKKVGYFVVDSIEELYAVDSIAKEKQLIQDVLLRLNPGIDPHTFKAVSTGDVDSKFGFGIKTGLANEAFKVANTLKNIKLCGFHCHMGSQIFDCSVFIDATDIMLKFIADVKNNYNFTTNILNLGGGIGVRYTQEQESPDIKAFIETIGTHILEKCKEYCIEMPCICFEPGRSIVADAGLTVYTVSCVKDIPEVRTYINTDGGMTDNVRYAMYKAPYTVVYPSNLNEECSMKCTVAGRCCESGDVIQPDVMLPKSIKRGDFVAVLTTGAYNYSMASNYNRIPRPPVIMIKNKKTYVAVRRETEEFVSSLDN